VLTINEKEENVDVPIPFNVIDKKVKRIEIDLGEILPIDAIIG
jgi:hypothetical protein